MRLISAVSGVQIPPPLPVFPPHKTFRCIYAQRDLAAGVDRRRRHGAGLGHDMGYFLCAVFYRST